MLDLAREYRTKLIEKAADYDDTIAEKYLMEEEISTEELIAAIRKATIALKVTPVFVGTAKQNKGVQPLLDGVCMFLPNPFEVENYALDRDRDEERVPLVPDPERPLVALAFKLEDGRYGQLTYMRLYQGRVRKGDVIVNNATGKKVKVPRLVRMHASEMHDIEEAVAGDIVAMFGVECSTGDTFTDGSVNYTMTSMYVPEPVIELAVAPKDKTSLANFSNALNRFTKEEPTFRVYRDEETGETIIRGMGELHLEIYIERIKREYNCEVIVGRPKVAFRETITKRAEFNYTHKKQTGGAGQFARVAGYIEPLEPENPNNYEFVDAIVGGVIAREFIPACDEGFQEQLKEGLLIGQPVQRVRVVLNDGSTHPVECYMRANPVVLEPIMKLEVSAPEEFQGVVIGQINQRRGVIIGTESEAGYVVITAEVPLQEMFGYSTDLRSVTQGKGEFTMEFLKYAQVPRAVQEEMVREYQKKRAEGNK
jgi:elongation factor G